LGDCAPQNVPHFLHEIIKTIFFYMKSKKKTTEKIESSTQVSSVPKKEFGDGETALLTAVLVKHCSQEDAHPFTHDCEWS